MSESKGKMKSGARLKQKSIESFLISGHTRGLHTNHITKKPKPCQVFCHSSSVLNFPKLVGRGTQHCKDNPESKDADTSEYQNTTRRNA